MEFPASWSLDSKETGFEKMESGINARAIDFAKFGRLFLNKGNWESTQVVPSAWVTEATAMGDDARAGNLSYYSLATDTPAFKSGTGYYKYHWWCWDRGNGNYDFTAAGNFGQYVYVCPSKNVIIVRNGTGSGSVDAWPAIFFRVAGSL
jgi:CubicO group peptidase (beta-lactamase class C family)